MTINSLKYQTILFQQENDVAYIKLNLPEKRNALGNSMISEIMELLSIIESNEQISFVIIRGEGKVFSAGADLQWVNNAMNGNTKQKEFLAALLSDFFFRIFTYPKPIISVVQGNAFGGALGIIAASDFVIADQNCRFSFSEVKLGLIPATISPYVIRKIGASKSKELMLTGKIFDASKAKQIGLITDTSEPNLLNECLEDFIKDLRFGKKMAQQEIKKLINHMSDSTIGFSEKRKYTEEIFTNALHSAEASVAIRHFLNKKGK